MVLKMFPVEDCNIVTNHLLQVIHTRLAYEAMSKSSVCNDNFASLRNLTLHKQLSLIFIYFYYSISIATISKEKARQYYILLYTISLVN